MGQGEGKKKKGKGKGRRPRRAAGQALFHNPMPVCERAQKGRRQGREREERPLESVLNAARLALVIVGKKGGRRKKGGDRRPPREKNL